MDELHTIWDGLPPLPDSSVPIRVVIEEWGDWEVMEIAVVALSHDVNLRPSVILSLEELAGGDPRMALGSTPTTQVQEMVQELGSVD